jgi:hypothetical protein
VRFDHTRCAAGAHGPASIEQDKSLFPVRMEAP